MPLTSATVLWFMNGCEKKSDRKNKKKIEIWILATWSLQKLNKMGRKSGVFNREILKITQNWKIGLSYLVNLR